MPLLSSILFLPLLGAIVLLAVPRTQEAAIKWIANLFALAGFVVSLPLWWRYDLQTAGFQFTERAEWIPSIGASYFVGVDGFSLLLVLLTTLMGVIATLSSWSAITERVKDTTSSCSCCRRACSARSWRSTCCCSSCSGR